MRKCEGEKKISIRNECEKKYCVFMFAIILCHTFIYDEYFTTSFMLAFMF